MNEDISPAQLSFFIEGFEVFQKRVHANAKSKGWWEQAPNSGEAVALMHSELSEALEALREGSPVSEKAVGFFKIEEELADVIIRIMDYAEGARLDVVRAMVAKHRYNRRRPYKHGKKF